MFLFVFFCNKNNEYKPSANDEQSEVSRLEDFGT